MQLQGLLFMLFILLIIPISVLFTNHFIFFGVMAVIIVIGSIKNISLRFFDLDSEEDDTDNEEIEGFEDMLNIDMKKFGTGTYVVKNLFLILFFIYCSFYLKSILLKIDVALLILIQIYYIQSFLKRNGDIKKEVKPSDRNLAMFSAILSLMLIVFTICNLIFGLEF